MSDARMLHGRASGDLPLALESGMRRLEGHPGCFHGTNLVLEEFARRVRDADRQNAVPAWRRAGAYVRPLVWGALLTFSVLEFRDGLALKGQLRACRSGEPVAEQTLKAPGAGRAQRAEKSGAPVLDQRLPAPAQGLGPSRSSPHHAEFRIEPTSGQGGADVGNPSAHPSMMAERVAAPLAA